MQLKTLDEGTVIEELETLIEKVIPVRNVIATLHTEVGCVGKVWEVAGEEAQAEEYKERR